MKNGVLDQKVDNEMKIMQKVRHVSDLLLRNRACEYSFVLLTFLC
jgi:hypothetical protein